MNDIDAIIKKADKLKPIPQVANKVMLIVQDSDSSIKDLSEVILYDQAVTANLLKICNSAYFSLCREINSLHQAIVFLGMDQVADLVLLASAAGNFKTEQKGYDLRENDLWRYSVSSALIARDLAEIKGSKNNHFIFTAALLKDIGKVVMSQYVSDSFDKIIMLVSEDGLSFREAEKEVIGLDHAELGGLIAKKWKFSDNMVDIIRNHHLSEKPTDSDFETSIVYLADTICMMMGIGVGSDGLAYRFYPDVLNSLGFSETDFQQIMVNFSVKFQEVEDMINKV